VGPEDLGRKTRAAAYLGLCSWFGQQSPSRRPRRYRAFRERWNVLARVPTEILAECVGYAGSWESLCFRPQIPLLNEALEAAGHPWEQFLRTDAEKLMSERSEEPVF
jgi:hypothetical protein